MKKILGLFSLCLMFGGSYCIAETVPGQIDDFEKARSAYESGDFQAAADIYEKFATVQPNGNLFYNLGSTYQRLGRTGDATAALLAARYYMPRDPDVKANLSFVQSNAKDQVVAKFDKTWPEKFWSWTQFLSPNEWWVLMSVLWCLAGLGYLLWIFRGRKTPFMVSFALTLFCSVGLYMRAQQGSTWSAIVGDEVSVHSEPTDQSTAIFKLHNGAPALVESESRNWLRIRIATPSESLYGWVKKDQVRSFL